MTLSILARVSALGVSAPVRSFATRGFAATVHRAYSLPARGQLCCSTAGAGPRLPAMMPFAGVTRPTCLLSDKTVVQRTGIRYMTLSADEVEKKMRNINDMFVEARELIADALDSVGTKYFEEDLEDAREMVKACLDGYDELLGELDEAKKAETQRSTGMKMRQLKDELGQIITSLTHDEDLPSSSRKD